MDHASGALPPGFVLCDGASYLTSTYPALFAAIGYVWGGAGASFNVPDSRGVAHIGAGTGTGLTPRVLGPSVFGAETHTLTSDQLAAHNHVLNDPPHTHGLMGNAGGGLANLNGATQIAGLAGASATGYVAGPPYVQQVNSGVTSNPTSGNNPHNNMQPSLVVTKMIKV